MAKDEKPKGLTIDQLRNLKGYRNISADQANEIIGSIKMLAHLCLEFINQKKKDTTEQDLKPISNNNKIKKTANKKQKNKYQKK